MTKTNFQDFGAQASIDSNPNPMDDAYQSIPVSTKVDSRKKIKEPEKIEISIEKVQRSRNQVKNRQFSFTKLQGK